MEHPGLQEQSAPFAGALQSFARLEDRERLTPSALLGIRELARRWNFSRSEAAGLLGVSESTWDRIRAGRWTQSLSQDQLMRISALLGLFKGLHLLFADAMADRWPRLPNRGALFANRTPIAAMIEGGIPMMLEVRGHVDALRGGL